MSLPHSHSSLSVSDVRHSKHCTSASIEVILYWNPQQSPLGIKNHATGVAVTGVTSCAAGRADTNTLRGAGGTFAAINEANSCAQWRQPGSLLKEDEVFLGISMARCMTTALHLLAQLTRAQRHLSLSLLWDGQQPDQRWTWLIFSWDTAPAEPPPRQPHPSTSPLICMANQVQNSSTEWLRFGF